MAVDEKFELTYLFGVDDLTGAEVALLGGAGDGEDGHDGGEEVHSVHHGWESWGESKVVVAFDCWKSEHERCLNWRKKILKSEILVVTSAGRPASNPNPSLIETMGLYSFD